MAIADSTNSRTEYAHLRHPSVLSNLLVGADGFFIVGAGVTLYVLYVGGFHGQFGVWPRYVLVTVLGAVIAITSLARGRGYDARPNSAIRKITRALSCWMGTFAVLLTAAFVFKISDDFSRVWAVSWMASVLIYLVASRVYYTNRLNNLEQSGRFAEPCAIVVGHHAQAERVITCLRSKFQIVGVFTDSERLNVTQIGGVPYRGGLDSLAELARSGYIARALIVLPWERPRRINEAIESLRALPIRIQFSSTHPLLFDLEPRGVELVNGLTLFTVVDRAISDWGRFVKRIEDVVFSVGALLIALPLMTIIAVAIKIDSPGPLFFVQERYGFAGNLFRVYKFRTLHHNMADKNASRLITRKDPRVTRVGRILRRTSLDELPQLLNVILGDMSLVGPRPHATQAKAAGQLYPQVVSDYFMRYRIKPGLTGWAQVRGWRGETDTVEKIRERVKHDLYYIDHWSVFFDLKILLFTLFSITKAETY